MPGVEVHLHDAYHVKRLIVLQLAPAEQCWLLAVSTQRRPPRKWGGCPNVMTDLQQIRLIFYQNYQLSILPARHIATIGSVCWSLTTITENGLEGPLVILANPLHSEPPSTITIIPTESIGKVRGCGTHLGHILMCELNYSLRGANAC